jgi:multicomponent Na+:H+ antiporter subunit A
LGLLAAALLVEQAAGTLSLSKLLAGDATLRQTETYPAIVTLVLLAAFTKSAQAPFHFWLPNAMTAPTPVSAYLHSATMVKAGVYLVARMTPLLGATPLWTSLVIGAGTITMALGAWRSVAETDLKRVLAYSTVSALGILMMLLGLGTESAVTAALVYLVAHACYKGTLFLVAGTLEHETGTRDVTALGGLRNSMPTVAMAGGLAACSMAGVPLFLGFVGKELLYGALWGHGEWWMNALVLIAVGASALLGAAGLATGVAPFFGPPGSAVATHRVPAALAVPSLILATSGLIAGLWPGAVDLPLGLAASSVVRGTSEAHLALWHGFTPVLALSLFTLAVTALLYKARDSVRQLIWPRSLGSERLYTLTLRGLDAVSAWSLPALQSASLRSYVLSLVVTAAVLLTAALTSAPLRRWPQIMTIQTHEAAAAVMIVAGAFSAVRAKSTITAVLSLGVVGYGVALTYLFFGAPDLAMTQFSVETLTAVIFVLVFYHFRAFGSLSPWRERARDASVAVLFGSSIAVILVFVGASVTPLRLADYFAEMGPRIAHGRNIVNVILVDFRALDTLGEITVLATAAIGVRAILRLGRGADRES